MIKLSLEELITDCGYRVSALENFGLCENKETVKIEKEPEIKPNSFAVFYTIGIKLG
jgi:hypothetical protein